MRITPEQRLEDFKKRLVELQNETGVRLTLSTYIDSQTREHCESTLTIKHDDCVWVDTILKLDLTKGEWEVEL